MPTSTGNSIGLVLAAGASSRFGGDKLLRPLHGRPLGAHIADTLRDARMRHLLAVCPAGNAARKALFAARGFEVIDNAEPARGMGHPLALGAQRAIELGAERLPSARRHAERHARARRALAASAASDASPRWPVPRAARPPFSPPRSCRPSRASTATRARHLLRAAAVVPAPAELVRDYDTPADFARLRRGRAARSSLAMVIGKSRTRTPVAL